MKYLSQLGLLAFLFAFSACQASPENQHTAEVSQKVVVPSTELPTERGTNPLADASEEETSSPSATNSEAVPAATKKAPSPATVKVPTKPRASSIEAVPAPKVKEENKTAETILPNTAPSPSPALVAPAEELPSAEVVEEAPVAVPVAPSHDSWNTLLTQFVTSTGKVNYKGLKAKQKELEAYLKLLSDKPVQTSWSRNEKMAYWINAYNAFTVKLILDNYPLSSITNLSGGKVWDKKWIKLGGKTYSLNNIENDILRPQYKDARIHFAVNCAAKSCPPLLNRAWTASMLNTYLERQAKQFINNSQYNQVGANKVVISKIFEWYAADFGNIVTYLNKYSTTSINANAQVSYQNYDWALNQ